MSNPYINALTGPSWLGFGDSTITYALGNTHAAAWTAAERAIVAKALAAYGSVCNLSFVETDLADAEIAEFKVTTAQTQQLRPHALAWHGWHDEPGAGQRSGFYDFTKDYWPGVVYEGSKAYWLLQHELGHALGLSHPHGSPYATGATPTFPGVPEGVGADAGDNGLNSVLTTTMSYRLTAAPSTSYGQVSGPMAFDIAALQEMYGAVDKATGDTLYHLPASNGAGTFYTCIWDTGGTDWIIGGHKADLINLQAATLENEIGGGGWLSAAAGIFGGFTIAHGVAIEAASGGDGADRIIGNAGSNALYGGNGNDTLTGGGGGDVLAGNGGADRLACGNDDDIDIVFVNHGDLILEFDGGEDRIDLTWFNARSVSVVASGADKLVRANTDGDAAWEIVAVVVGGDVLRSDLIW